jgi:aspartate/methionine/tyrosine aminotransferase
MTEFRFENDDVPLAVLRDRAHNMRWAEQPDGVVPLTAADPDFACAPAIREAVVDYVSAGVLSYGPAGGLRSFREAVSGYLERRSCAVPPDGVIATNSAAAGLSMVAHHLLGPGDEAIIPDPVDFLFEHTIRAAGATPVRWPLTRHGVLDLDALEQRCTPATRAVYVCNPHNPLGRCFSRDELVSIAEFCTERGITVVSDEIWSDIVHQPATFTSMLALPPDLAASVVMVHGFSKSFALAGLRIGYVASPSPAFAAEMLARSQHPSTVDGASTLAQVAASAAYDRCMPWLDAFVAHLTARRDQCVDLLRSIPGVTVETPDATYVALARLPDGMSPELLADHARDQHGVAVVPGSPRWFGEGAAGHVRVCFATSDSILATGLDRLDRAIRSF